MKKVLSFLCASALATAAFAIPDDVAFGNVPFAYARPPSVLVLDEGGGDVAMVVIAEKGAFATLASAVLRPSVAAPRIIAIVLDDGAMRRMPGEDKLVALVDGVLKCKGISSACIVSCGDCSLGAAAVADTLSTVSGLVLLQGSALPQVELKKPLFIAGNAGELKPIAAGNALAVTAARRIQLFKEYLLEPRLPED